MSEKATGPHFVWIRGIVNRPEPQKWHELDYGVDNWKLTSGYVIQAHPIDMGQFASWPLAALVAKFPAPLTAETGEVIVLPKEAA